MPGLNKIQSYLFQYKYAIKHNYLIYILANYACLFLEMLNTFV